eukprot:COSAG01_NODE_4641_length_4858_cov_6.174827_2_plen_168_part_00
MVSADDMGAPAADVPTGGAEADSPPQMAAAAAVSHLCACIGSPCLRQCVHGAPIGGRQPPSDGGGGGGGGVQGVAAALDARRLRERVREPQQTVSPTPAHPTPAHRTRTLLPAPATQPPSPPLPPAQNQALPPPPECARPLAQLVHPAYASRHTTLRVCAVPCGCMG